MSVNLTDISFMIKQIEEKEKPELEEALRKIKEEEEQLKALLTQEARQGETLPTASS